LVKIARWSKLRMALKLLWSFVPGATPKKPFSGLIA